MLQLSRLSTSLTKHGAHKIAWLLEKFDPKDVMSKLSYAVPGINIEAVQARKNLSVDAKGRVPAVWSTAKKGGPATIKALVLVAIIFSHYDLVRAMRTGALTKHGGRIVKGDVLDGKAYTNFAHILDELGYGSNHTEQHVDFNFDKLFAIKGLNHLVVELLALKMATAGWDGKGDVRQVLLELNLHQVFAAGKAQFQSWLVTGDLNESLETLEDADYFLAVDAETGGGVFKFKPGHIPKKTGTVTVKTPVTSGTADLIHNLLQTKLYEALVAKYGKECVGCEVPTGYGTSIDVVVQTKTFIWFFELKVADTVKACIRQAVPQLLEYAYWRDDVVKADRLIIVAQHPLNARAAKYLERLRDEFLLPLYYEQFDGT